MISAEEVKDLTEHLEEVLSMSIENILRPKIILLVKEIINENNKTSNSDQISYITEKEASLRYGYSRQWFQRERWKVSGPKFIKLNSGKILYPTKETDEWFASFGMVRLVSKQ